MTLERRTVLKWTKWVGLSASGIALIATAGVWWPSVNSWADRVTSQSAMAAEEGADVGHEGHDHGEGGHEGHDHGDHAHGHEESTALELSPQAMRNLGLTGSALEPVKLETFDRSITLPASIVDQPGRTHLEVSAPLTGVVTRVAAVEGEAVRPGELLFEMRVTHEDLVKAQTEFLKTLGELDVEQKEVARLSGVTRSGAVAGRVLLERQYERDKLQAVRDAQREALMLHGLSAGQIDTIANDRRLLRTMKVFAPTPGADTNDSFQLARQPIQPVAFEKESAVPLTLSEIRVQTGQSVETGSTLCVLTDLSELYVEALAFEQDAEAVAAAMRERRPVSAVFDLQDGQARRVDGLKIRFLSNQIDPDGRTLSAFVEVPNELMQDTKGEDGTRFVDWRYRPGQRLQLRVPVERWDDRIVLPVDAVAREGAESFVFVQNGDHFDRVPVQVEYRDQYDVVVSNDGAIFPGDVVARRGAHQMQMALKNKSGGGVDPHAGHNH